MYWRVAVFQEAAASRAQVEVEFAVGGVPMGFGGFFAQVRWRFHLQYLFGGCER